MKFVARWEEDELKAALINQMLYKYILAYPVI